MSSELDASTLNSLGEKLESFAEGLSSEERQALGGVIARAEAASEAEVGGFVLRNQPLNFRQVTAVPRLEPGLPSQLGNSLGGFGDAASIGVVWNW